MDKSRRFLPIEQPLRLLVPAILLAALALVLVRNAWVSDDAYITFRTVRHIVDGFGPTWNVNERVQTYTHPLWLLLHASVYLFTREAFYTTIIISVMVTLGTLVFYAASLARSAIIAGLGILAAIFSKAFIDYSTSGLENPLTHLLCVFFLMVFVRPRGNLRVSVLLGFIAALIALNRMDAILLVAPALVYHFWQNRSFRTLLALGIGFFPFAVWELFSLFYYGFPFPNTAYAKLNTGIAWPDLAVQGFHYFWNSLRIDPLTLTVIIAAVVGSSFKERRKHIPITAGILLYLLFVLRIGGCFMTGRLFSAPFICALIILSRYQVPFRHWGGVAAAGIIVVLGLIPPFSPVYTTPSYGGETVAYRFDHGLVDEKGWYFQTSSLSNIHPQKKMLAHRMAQWGRETTSPTIYAVIIGYFGYFAPDSTHIIDSYALADPLRARLPVRDARDWRIGHFERDIPDGYAETLSTGQNYLRNPGLASYYSRLALITRGELCDWNRITTIIKFNLGMYDYLVDGYR